jgi:ATP-dependent RNA helicase DHX36
VRSCHFDKDGGKTESGSEKTEPANLNERKDPLLDESVMEKVLRRKSIRMRNFQRTWPV